MRTSIAVLCLLLGCGAQAHDSSVSHSLWKVSGSQAEARLKVAERDLGSRDAKGETANPPLAQQLRLHAAGEPCLADEPPLEIMRDRRWRMFQWSVSCTAPPDRIESTLFPHRAPSHLHIAHVQDGDGKLQELLLNSSRPGAGLTTTASGAPSKTFVNYLRIGTEHILLGWDHLSFLALLFLLASRVSEVLLLITGFTLAHSLTLAAATLGWLEPAPAAIEAIIAFSIVLVAVENTWRLSSRHPFMPLALVTGLLVLTLTGGWALDRIALLGLALFTACYFLLTSRHHANRNWRALLVGVFGLAHGCGFAGALQEVGLPDDGVAPALLAFNLGVEAGQLLALALLLPLLAMFRRYRQAISALAASLIGGIGMYWFIGRLILA